MKTEPNIKQHFGKQVVENRMRLHITQQTLAAHLQVSRITIRNIEKGINNTSLDNVYKICCVLNVTPTAMFPKVIPVKIPKTKGGK